ncbi:MAG: hypothetical protein JO253_04315, partial [Alphaproteobacteria bacterium]|nr:hypothetical protein [Alphaproteobacteria bacterium]
MQRTLPLRLALVFASLLYFTAWGYHLYVDTALLRGFWGDGAMEFLVHLSRSYVFTNEPPRLDNIWVHLFSVGNPRDGALFLNALGLQAALWLNITDASTLKHIFVFWQYALPGFLYLGLIVTLWRTGRAAWAIFPLVSWTVCSVPVDWNAVNNARWAVPLFWMHVMLCLHARPGKTWRDEAPALVALGLLGALMLAGLYESVVGQLALTAAAGFYIRHKEGNNRPLLYSLAALPGAIGALWSYLATGQNAQNGLHEFILPKVLPLFPVAALIILPVLAVPILALTPPRARPFVYAILPACLIYWGIRMVVTPPLPIWEQVNFRFDYIFMALGLMTMAAACRCLQNLPQVAPERWAAPVVLLALCTGALLWQQQVTQSGDWRSCMDDYQSMKSDKPLLLSAELRPLIQFNDTTMQAYNRRAVHRCLWDWATPWTDMLMSQDGRV